MDNPLREILAKIIGSEEASYKKTLNSFRLTK